ETGVHPRITTEQNIANMVRQLKRLGLGYDWDRTLATTDPGYYRWTQWIFLRLWNSYVDPATGHAKPIGELVAKLESEKYLIGTNAELIADFDGLDALEGQPIGSRPWSDLTQEQRHRLLDEYRLAYLAEVDVNWCPALGTVLANEEVTAEGRSERGNHPVFKRPLKQWMLRITAFADRLIEDLDLVEWPESIKLLQRNWIGKSIGAEVDFAIADREAADTIRVFTTRPDTLFGATYMVLAPEHPLVPSLTSDEQSTAVEAYVVEAAKKTNVDRQQDAKEKTGVFTGGYAINPVNNQPIPVWVADYVMMGYGTGAIMAVPAHDERDFEFAEKFGLPIRDVVYTDPLEAIAAFCDRCGSADVADEAAVTERLADFVSFVISSGSRDYDDIYARIAKPREDTPDAAKAKRSDRGKISSIWREALEPFLTKGVPALLAAGRDGGLIALQGQALTESGRAVRSANDEVSLDGLDSTEAKARITAWLQSKALGQAKVQYKLRDWLFSRQRYWGEPFPVLHELDDAGQPTGHVIGVPEEDLPVELPELDDFKPEPMEDPDAPPRPPLGRAPASWRIVERDGKRYARELNTMPQWAGSCWYYLRYLDPHNDEAMVDPATERYWMTGDDRRSGVDLYVGGVEHAVLHLLYARFWHKVLYDLGHVSTPEPFGKLFNQGYIQAYYYEDDRGVRVPATEVTTTDGKPAYEAQGTRGAAFVCDGQPVSEKYGKMGKSLKNAVAPDDICEQYGADTLRLYEMYMGPLDQSKPWNPQDIVGVHRFLQRVWRNFVDDEADALLVEEHAPDDDQLRLLHKTIKAVTDAMGSMSVNVAIAKLIEMNNAMVAMDTLPRALAEDFVRMLGPLAPHLAEELWDRLGFDFSVTVADWPTHDERFLIEDTVELPVQVNGKLRGRIEVAADAATSTIEASAREAAESDEAVAAATAGKSIRKVIVVPGRLVNLVVG
ncbi:MAG: class I tRNA ligase family protein, partial [Planctomycetota bacterium]